MAEINKDNYIVLLRENESQRKQIAALTHELGELQYRYERDVNGISFGCVPASGPMFKNSGCKA